jgi:pimeloyl-ACP methyl ester carboxylesterase
MLPELEKWKKAGEYISYGPNGFKIFVKQLGKSSASVQKTLLLIHGFPESSYSYHAVVEGLLKIFDRIILFDMLGYGLSDKPEHNYSYSLLEQADTAFIVWKHFGIKGGHILSHDMGDSVATEILSRHENNLLPVWFSQGIQSMTFTNGSMVLEMAELRITQKILLSKYGHLLSHFNNFHLFKNQVLSAHGNKNLSDKEIQILFEAAALQEGHQKFYLTIKYLNDRKQFEKTRWLPALKNTQLPIHICWGEDDAVAKVEMAHYLKKEICKNAKLTIMKDLGHFCQLENPKRWVEFVSTFYKEMN